ncbi:hypothetical protein Pmani_003909 [Petrolisthes manimaculis]|uniref:Carboxylesterase type B domain-containing protein n=1 Tax=Petrolisthes manimaculis TaxID=1843537 RepID=A0AAE1UHY0_9EUCA|nr:hypothetical protein Pmani_003909 [Petrolisthes manimaculis]
MQRSNLGLLLLSVVSVIQVSVGDVDEVVQVSGGLVRGSLRRSDGGKDYMAYQAIPYAFPPVNASRFMPPRPGVTWEGVLDGSVAGPPCAQAALGIKAGQEDCLHVYVYTTKVKNAKDTDPDTDPDPLLPVLVWLHGGSFVLGGAAALDQTYIMDRDLVLVVPQYRLGILGYLQTIQGISPGNMGQLDQVLALQWVRENIHVFGGDHNQVTLAGDCAGGASAVYHMLSPLSHGLFHRVLSLSGSPLNPWALYTNNHRFLLIFANYIRCPAYDPAVLIKCLREIDVDELLDAVQLVIEARDLLVGNHRLSPSVQEPAHSHLSTLYLDQHPLHFMNQGDVARVPVLMSLTRDVGGYLVDMVLYEFIEAMMEDQPDFLETLIPMLLKESFVPNPNDHVKEFVDFYFPGVDMKDLTAMLPGLVKMLGDLQYRSGIFTAASLLSQHVPTYFLRFEYEGGPKLFDIRHPNASAAPPLPSPSTLVGHGDEMNLILPDQHFTTFTQEQKLVRKHLLDIVENYVHGRAPREDWPLFTSYSAAPQHPPPPTPPQALVLGPGGSFRSEQFATPEEMDMLTKIHTYQHHKVIYQMEQKKMEMEHDEL